MIVGALLANRIGRRNTMMLGFTGYLVFGLAVGLAYDTVILNVPAFIVLYGLFTSFGNLGPGDMLGLTSSESYATPVRGTLYGLSAAIGKFGAVVGNQSFLPIRTNLGPKYTFVRLVLRLPASAFPLSFRLIRRSRTDETFPRSSQQLSVCSECSLRTSSSATTSEEISNSRTTVSPPVRPPPFLPPFLADVPADLISQGWTGEIGADASARLIVEEKGEKLEATDSSDEKVVPTL